MSKRIIVTMAALLLLLASVASAQTATKATAKSDAATSEAKTEKAPRLTIVEPVKEYGTVAKGDKITWSFLVKNTGDANLEVLAARPSCGCTVADFDKVIKPGETGKITATVDTAAFTGPINKSITVETNDTTSPSAQLTLKANVKPYVEAFPAGYVRYSNLVQGDSATQSVTLYSEEDQPFEIVKVEAPEWIKVTTTKITDAAQRVQNVGTAGQNQYKIDITAGGVDVKPGPIAEKIHIVTNSKHQPDYFISVVGIVRPSVLVDQRSGVNFGEVAPNDPAATRSIVVKSGNMQNPEVLTVSGAESSVPAIATSVKPTLNKGEYEVTLHVVPTAKPGDVDGTVTIHTNDKVNPTVVLPIKGTIKAAAATSSSKSK